MQGSDPARNATQQHADIKLDKHSLSPRYFLPSFLVFISYLHFLSSSGRTILDLGAVFPFGLPATFVSSSRTILFTPNKLR